MSRQPNRLAAGAPHGFGGAELDRSKPLRFALDGRSIAGFAGDTVMSALLAAGIDTVGRRAGETLALDERFAPAVTPAGANGDPGRALPMDRTPAVHGLDLVTMRPGSAPLVHNSLLRRLLAPRHSLDLQLDGPAPLLPPWLLLPAEVLPQADTIVVGGGLAGMSAALAAATAGERVVLVERRPMLGGDARFFGAVDDEEPPAAAIARLTRELAGFAGVTVLLCAEAFAIAGATGIRAHQVEMRDGRPQGRVVDVPGKRLVLATGAAESLPIFPGNRLPGVTGTIAAFHRAERYGVWPGKRTLFSTNRNSAYRLAMLAKDAGIEVVRVVDTRLDPQSRFIDFTKASGITSAAGLILREVVPAKRRRAGLSVGFAVAIEEIAQDTAPLQADRIVAAGGWQPALSLWLLAGGNCAWNAAGARLEARDGPENVALAGAAAGYAGHTACQQSGRAAVARLLGRRAIAVDDPQIEAIYETPDDITPVAPQRNRGLGHAYLDGGRSLTMRPAPSRRRNPEQIFGTGRPLSVGDVVGAVRVGALPQADAGIIAAERCLAPGDIVDTGWHLPAMPQQSPEFPSYLAGRFPGRPQQVVVCVPDRRMFEAGCLMFTSSEASHPRDAVGVIIGPAPDGRSGGLALTGRLPAASRARYFVRDSSGAVPVELLKAVT